MRGWKMMVKAPNGLVFPAKVLEMSDRHVVASGDYVLKHSMRCNLEIVRSIGYEKSASTKDEVDAAVEEVVFAQGSIRIVYRVAGFTEEFRKAIEACGARRARPLTIRV